MAIGRDVAIAKAYQRVPEKTVLRFYNLCRAAMTIMGLEQILNGG